MNKKRKQILIENEVSEIREFTLGGFPQKVAIDGRKRKNSVVISRQGGDGENRGMSAKRSCDIMHFIIMPQLLLNFVISSYA